MASALEKTKKTRCGVFLKVVTTSTLILYSHKAKIKQYGNLQHESSNELNSVDRTTFCKERDSAIKKVPKVRPHAEILQL